MLDDIYNAKILELAGNIPRIGRLAEPDATARAHSRLCGSTVTVDLKMAEGRVSDFAHDVKACALGQASSSPDGRWGELKYLEPVRDYKARHASTMLTFDAVVDAVNQIEAKKG
jgi:NifU-like protein involved in Fe-S cluster formation